MKETPKFKAEFSQMASPPRIYECINQLRALQTDFGFAGNMT